jgi:Secretion system C-terminal sorting domain
MKRIAFTLLFLVSFSTNATHLRAGYITVQPTNCAFEYRITLNVFVNTDPSETTVDFGGGTLRFGDGNSHTTPIIESMPVSGLENVGLIQYSVNHVYQALGTYLISYEELNRNSGIINIPNSVNIPFSIKTLIEIDPFKGCNSSPQFIAAPVFNAITGTTITTSFAAKSVDDLVLDYSLITPSGGFTMGNVPNYIWLENVSINPYNGLFSWNTADDLPIPVGEYVFTIRVRMWKLVNDVLNIVGYTDIDVMIVLEDSQIETDITPKEDLAENGRVYIPVGESKTLKFFSEADQLADLAAYSELSINENAFSFTTYDSSSSDIKVGVLTLHATEEIDRDNPYIITIRGNREGTNFASDLNLMLYTHDLYPEPIVTGLANEATFEIFPNPTSDWLSVKLPENSCSKIQLTSLNGERLAVLENSSKLNLTELPPGLYILKIETPQKRGTLKVIKR